MRDMGKQKEATNDRNEQDKADTHIYETTQTVAIGRHRHAHAQANVSKTPLTMRAAPLAPISFTPRFTFVSVLFFSSASA